MYAHVYMNSVLPTFPAWHVHVYRATWCMHVCHVVFHRWSCAAVWRVSLSKESAAPLPNRLVGSEVCSGES